MSETYARGGYCDGPGRFVPIQPGEYILPNSSEPEES